MALPNRALDPTLPLSTPYYSATIPIWHDTIPTSSDGTTDHGDLVRAIKTWEQEWLLPEAGEVVRALGAVVVVFRKPASKEDLVCPFLA